MVRASSVWRWQLLFAGTLVTVAVMVAAFSPQVYGSAMFIAGLASVIVLTLVVIALPWDRLPGWLVVLVPALDILAIGLTTHVADIRLGFLWVFPVTWIATYYSMPYIVGSIGLVSVCLLVFGNNSGVLSDILLRVLIVVLTLGFLGASIRVGVQRSRASRRLLRRQSQQVHRMAARAQTHQRRVTQIIDALDTALVSVSGDGEVLHMNDAYRRLYGRDTFGEWLPSRAVEYDDLQGEPVPPHRTALARAARGEQLHSDRIWLYDAEATWRVLEATSYPIESSSDTQMTMLLILDDITARLAAEREKQTMAAIVSHELRNPLTAILGHVDLLLERDDLPPRVASQLETIANASERMNRLVTGVLDQSKQSAAPLSEPVDLRQIVQAAVDSFRPTARGKDLTVRVSGVDTLSISGDAFRLRQAMDNLLSNAVKYTPAAGRVSISLGPDADGAAEVVVADTGIGMTQEDVDRVFHPYFRAEQAEASTTPGTGLGMGIVRDIIVEHGGTIEVHSEPEQGTRVIMRFPSQPTTREES